MATAIIAIELSMLAGDTYTAIACVAQPATARAWDGPKPDMTQTRRDY